MPLFNKDWWLDIVCGSENWNVVIETKDNKIVASLTFYTKNKYFFSWIGMPSLTQNMGLYIKYPLKQKYTSMLSYEKDITMKLINQLPKFDYFAQNLNYNITNVLPFYWNNFKHSIGYTYIIDDFDDIYNRFRTNIRTDIKKALKLTKIISDDDLKKFYEVNMLTFRRQKIKPTYSFELIEKIDNECKKKDCRKILFAEDKDGNVHASIYLVWDDTSVYYLMSGGNPEYRNSGATSLLIYEGIKFAEKNNKIFDFEGSMLEPVERFVRSFGAIQTPYIQVQKINSKILKFRSFFKDILYER